MANVINWLGAGSRANDALTRINDKPTSIVFTRGNTDLAAQTVRVEVDSTVQQIQGANGSISGRQRAIIFGVHGHPTVANTDVQRGDRFSLNGAQYRVEMVTYQKGEVQAIGEAQS